jgi:hypothetical protein
MQAMSPFSKSWEETDRRLRAAVAPELAPGEEIVGVVHANQAKTFSAELFAVGVTADRLVVVPLDRKMAASGAAESVTRADIRSSSVWGWGGSIGDFLSPRSGNEIRFETPLRSYKLMVLGGTLFEDALSGEGQRAGLEAFIEFLQSARA